MKIPLLSVLLALIIPGLYADDARGKVLYAQLCFTCPGPHLDGGIGPALGDAYWRHGSSPDAILAVINKGVPETEMAAFEAVYPASDREALRDFILSQQEGLREVLCGVYPRAALRGKRLTPALFDAVVPLSEAALPENVYYLGRGVDGVMRGRSKLYIREAGEYQIAIRPGGRTSIFLDGEAVHYSDDKAPKNTHLNKKLTLKTGTYDLEILHEEKTTHSYRFYGALRRTGGGAIMLTGRSLEGSVPKVLRAGTEARVARKWIAGLPPRTLLCLLPNRVIVAYNPVDNQVLRAWHTAEINQTPSLDGRSQQPSAIQGTPITAIPELGQPDSVRFLYYEVVGESARIVSVIAGQKKSVTIAPEGPQSFTVSSERL